jgi:hypothetical protein
LAKVDLLSGNLRGQEPVIFESQRCNAIQPYGLYKTEAIDVIPKRIGRFLPQAIE